MIANRVKPPFSQLGLSSVSPGPFSPNKYRSRAPLCRRSPQVPSLQHRVQWLCGVERHNSCRVEPAFGRVTSRASLSSNSEFAERVLAAALGQRRETGIDSQVVFISPTPYPPGKAILQPLPKVVFWFQSHLETATMISEDVSNPFFLNLSGGTSATISFDKDGKWHRDRRPVEN